MTLPNGFPLGVEKDGQYYLYNHVRIWMQSPQNLHELSRCFSVSFALRENDLATDAIITSSFWGELLKLFQRLAPQSRVF